ncbi:MAG: PocR ligand-binding domain-containing protein [Elusimicrobiota bacterium]
MPDKEKYKIKGIANVKVLNTFQDIFFDLTGLNVVFINKKGEFITRRRGRRPFCLQVKKSGFEDKCRQCDKKACLRVKKERKPVIYRCFAGLTEMAVPIMLNKKLIAIAMAGQVRTGDKNKINSSLKKETDLKTYIRLKKSFNKIPLIKRKKLESYAQMLMLVVNYIFRKEHEVLLTKGKLPRSSGTGRIVDKTLKYIKKNYSGKIYLKDIAASVHVSQSYLSRVFSEETGFTISDYIKKMRLEKAVRLLKKTDRPIKEVAYMSGYEGLPYFYKLFKKHYKITPKTFRETYR